MNDFTILSLDMPGKATTSTKADVKKIDIQLKSNQDKKRKIE